MTPRGWLLVAKRVLRPDRLFNPAFTARSIRWGIQHLRTPRDYAEIPPELAEQLSEHYYGTMQTAPEYRRLGVGSALHGATSNMLRLHGATEVCGWIPSDNVASLALHEKAGCELVAEAQRLGEKCWLFRQSLVEEPGNASHSADSTEGLVSGC